MLEDLRVLMRDDRDAVRRYRNKTVFGDNDPAHAQEPDMGDILIADNITIGAPAPSALPLGAGTESSPTGGTDLSKPTKIPAWLKAAIATAALGGIGGLGLTAYDLQNPAPQPQVQETPAYGIVA